MFPNFWQSECSGGARRRAWKQSGLCQTLNATVSKVDNLVWLPTHAKTKTGRWDPRLTSFVRGPVLANSVFTGIQVLPKVLPGPTVA